MMIQSDQLSAVKTIVVTLITLQKVSGITVVLYFRHDLTWSSVSYPHKRELQQNKKSMLPEGVDLHILPSDKISLPK